MIPNPFPGDNPLSPTDPLAALGEPLATYGRLLLAADDARAREQAAQVRGDVDAAGRAALDREEAQFAITQFRHHHVTALLLVLRWAGEDNPTALQEHLDPRLREELDRVETAVVDGEGRLDELEDAVLDMESEGAA